jgi:hypothetical protein
MNLQRIFLGLTEPPLASAARWLAKNFHRETPLGSTFDLSNTLVVLPTTRSRHRILQLLIRVAEEQSLIFRPPRLMTIGALPEHLYIAERPLASELTQHIAWVRAIQQTPASELQPLLGEQEADEQSDFQSLASVISGLHVRLANDIWSFNSVRRYVAEDKSFLANEVGRWEALTGIQQRYYKLLAEENLWDKFGARNYAAAGLLKADEIRCSTDREIILVGCADLNRSTSEMLRQVAVAAATSAENDRAKVTALIAAEESMTDDFNDFGSIISDRWLNKPIPLDDSQILIADRPNDQAFAVAWHLSKLGSNEDQPTTVAADEITIGVPDESLAPLIERNLRSIDLSSRHLAGSPISKTAPAMLLYAVNRYLTDQRYDSFASLVRHPDLFNWISTQIESDAWLEHLDEFQNQLLPRTIRLEQTFPFGVPDQMAKQVDTKDPNSPARAKRQAELAELLNQVHASIAELLKPLTGPSRSIADWGPIWSSVLIEVYRNVPITSEQAGSDGRVNSLASCESILSLLNGQQDVPDSFSLNTSAAEALNWVMDAAGRERIVPDPVPDGIELAGWLDLSLDDALVMIVTSFNEGIVPTSEVGHQFLPNALCERLQVQDNNRRYARDAYALTTISQVRKHLLIIAGRRDSEGNPLRPSRLLFADKPDVSARRARAFFQHEDETRVDHWLTSGQTLAPQQRFSIPKPAVDSIPDNLTVTSFREYISCPYRFYLKKVLRLETASDDLTELDGGAFGDLCHNTLEAFANDPIHDSHDEHEIGQFLSSELDRQAELLNQGSQVPSVQIQVEQLRQRLLAFAPRQAEHRKDGWRIVSTEELLEHQLDVDGSPFTIRGKIDRVDQHEQTGQVAVWDYKTTAKGPTPDSKHFAEIKKEWKDLQLPLYRYLVKEVAAVANANLDDLIVGFVLLHENASEIRFCPAEKLLDMQASADEKFREIVRGLRSGTFWPPVYPPPAYSDDYASICEDFISESFDITGEVAS